MHMHLMTNIKLGRCITGSIQALRLLIMEFDIFKIVLYNRPCALYTPLIS